MESLPKSRPITLALTICRQTAITQQTRHHTRPAMTIVFYNRFLQAFLYYDTHETSPTLPSTSEILKMERIEWTVTWPLFPLCPRVFRPQLGIPYQGNSKIKRTKRSTTRRAGSQTVMGDFSVWVFSVCFLGCLFLWGFWCAAKIAGKHKHFVLLLHLLLFQTSCLGLLCE
jgi:hypothetical protein